MGIMLPSAHVFATKTNWWEGWVQRRQWWGSRCPALGAAYANELVVRHGQARAAVGISLPRVASLPPRFLLFVDVAFNWWWGPMTWRRRWQWHCWWCGVLIVIVMARAVQMPTSLNEGRGINGVMGPGASSLWWCGSRQGWWKTQAVVWRSTILVVAAGLWRIRQQWACPYLPMWALAKGNNVPRGVASSEVGLACILWDIVGVEREGVVVWEQRNEFGFL